MNAEEKFRAGLEQYRSLYRDFLKEDDVYQMLKKNDVCERSIEALKERFWDLLTEIRAEEKKSHQERLAREGEE